ncbi:MAG: conjugative transfer signal peptidase TraF [Burkholderiales bacterium]|nr:conjugative transfer signal peptidase TraF [Burkholderiales bacterium]
MNKIITILCTLIGVTAAVAPTAYRPSVRVVYNASSSAPLGWYRIQSVTSPKVGDYVLATLPRGAAALAAQRDYLPAGLPILKRVSAVAGQHVCARGEALMIDGTPNGRILRSDRQGRPLPTWRHCRSLAGGELFLLSATNPASFDSRYFGPVPASSVRGQAVPLWTWRAS